MEPFHIYPAAPNCDGNDMEVDDLKDAEFWTINCDGEWVADCKSGDAALSLVFTLMTTTELQAFIDRGGSGGLYAKQYLYVRTHKSAGFLTVAKRTDREIATDNARIMEARTA